MRIKKIVSIVVILSMCIVLVACSSDTNDSNTTEDTNAAIENDAKAEETVNDIDVIDFYVSMLGKELNESGGITVSEEENAMLSSDLAGIPGNASMKTDDNGEYCGSVSWASTLPLGVAEYIDLLNLLEGIYGEQDRLTDLEDRDGENYKYIFESNGIVTWQEDGYTVNIGYDTDLTVMIVWLKDGAVSTTSNDSSSNRSDEYGLDQMVGYDTLVSLPEGSPVWVNGIAYELSPGLYSMSIFVKDTKDLGIDDTEEKTIYVYDPNAVQQSFDKRYISVKGHTNLRNDMPMIEAEEIEDQSDDYVSYGGVLPD